jgi:two-component system, response regulator PdtaR
MYWGGTESFQKMCHVLIIEDDALLALDIEHLLSACGATSFSFAVTEQQAVCAAALKRPAVITADVRLREGSGPQAVARIEAEVGLIPALFITGTPEECIPCDPPHRVFEKPVDDHTLVRAFREVAFSH